MWRWSLVALAIVAGACGSSSGGSTATPSSGSPSPATAPAGPGATLPTAGSSPFNNQSFGGGFGLGPPTSTQCTAVPRPAAPLPTWLPADLPLPAGTVLAQQMADVGNYHRAVFATVGRVEFVRYVLREWPAKGWAIGRGDTEPGESEAAFARTGMGGAFRSRDAYCDNNRSELLLVLGTTPGERAN
jgi:hypothetical protein